MQLTKCFYQYVISLILSLTIIDIKSSVPLLIICIQNNCITNKTITNLKCSKLTPWLHCWKNDKRYIGMVCEQAHLGVHSHCI